MEELPIAIVIPTYNDSKHLKNCILSISRQIHKPKQIIVIDDGSMNDDAFKVCNSKIFKILNIEYFKVSNGGPSRARNLGLGYVKTKYVLFLDADDLLLPNALIALNDSAKNMSQNYFGVCGRIKFSGKFISKISNFVPEYNINNIGRIYGLQGQISSYLLDAAKVREINGFMEDMKHYEDFYLLLQLLDQYKLTVINLVTLVKIQRRGSLSNANYKKSFLGAIKFLDRLENKRLMDPFEIRVRRKEAYLTYAKKLLINFKLKKFYLALKFAFKDNVNASNESLLKPIYIVISFLIKY